MKAFEVAARMQPAQLPREQPAKLPREPPAKLPREPPAQLPSESPALPPTAPQYPPHGERACHGKARFRCVPLFGV